jgi:hypothetical protein
LHVPELGTNLFSIGSATEAGMKAVFTGTSVNILSPDGNTFVEGERAARTMYHLKIRSKVNIDHAAAATPTGQRISPEILHQRLGHVNFKNLKRMATQLLVDGLNTFQVTEEEWKAFKETIYKCSGCAQGKMHKTSYNHSSTHIAQACGDRVHTDYCGPMSNASLGGARFFALFKDEWTEWFDVYFMKDKSEIPHHFESFRVKMETQTGHKIKVLRSDNAAEYVSARQRNTLTELGIIHEKSAPYTPQQNGMAERENRTVVEMARSMLYASKSKLPPSLWAEAIAYATYILKRIPSSKSTSSPFEKWNGTKPNLSHLRIFGSRTFVHVPDVKRTKFQPKCIEGVLVGFCESSKAYRVYIPTQRKVLVSLDVIIDETRGYEGGIPYPNATDSLIDSQIQIDPFIDQTVEPARVNINEDEITTEGDGQVNSHAAEEVPIPDAQTDYILPGGANTTIDVDEQQAPSTKGNEEETTEREHMEIDEPAEQVEVPTNQLQQIQTDSEVGLRRSTRMLNPKYIKVKSFKGMSAVVDDEAVDTVAEEAFKELTLDYDIKRESFQPTSALFLEPYVPINYNDALTCSESEK